MGALRHSYLSLAWMCIGVATCTLTGGQEPEITPGQRAITLTDVCLRVGEETIGTAPMGTEVLVEVVKVPWVWIKFQTRQKELSGWVTFADLLPRPQESFARLFEHHCSAGLFFYLSPVFSIVDLQKGFSLDASTPKKLWGDLAESSLKRIDRNGDGTISLTEWCNQPAEAKFLRVDRNRDGYISREEFLGAIEKPTLTDLNARLAEIEEEIKARLRGRDPDQTGLIPVFAGDLAPLLFAIGAFEGWQKDPTEEESIAVLRDFLTKRDLRSSRVAQRLTELKNPGKRQQEAMALFAWADKDRDGRLSLEEFREAFPDDSRTSAGEEHRGN